MARKLASPVPALNHLGAEISILLETSDIGDPIGAHLPGKLNGCADFLSRCKGRAESEGTPEALKGAKIRSIVGRKFLLPTAAQRPKLWSGEGG